MKNSVRVFMKSLVVVLLVLNFVGAVALPLYAAADQAEKPGEGAAAASPVTGGRAWAIAIVVGVSCLAAGYAVARVGSAGMGALSENPEVFGRALVFVALAEGIAIYGLVIGLLLLFMA